MESIHNTLRLYMPLSEKSCVSPPLSRCRGTDSSFSASLKPPRELPKKGEEEEEEDCTTESEKPSFHLADFREILQVLDDFCEIRQLAEVLRLHFHCQAVVDMGNRQGVKVKPCCHGFGFNHDSFPKSRFQVLKNRRAKGGVYTNNRITVRLPPVPSKISSSFGVQDSQIICRSLSRKRRTIRGPAELQPSWNARTDFPFKKDLSSRKGSSIILESSLPDSDTDQSEYDNEKYSSSGNLENVRITKDDDRCAPTAKKIQPGGDRDWAKTAGEEKHSSLWMKEEKGNKAVAQRLMGKIEELEGIIHQVRLSSDWMDGGGDGRDEAHCIMNGDAQRDNLTCRKMFFQNTRYSDDERHLKEFQVLGEALNRSLRQVLKMEAAKAERDSSIKTEEITLKPNQSRSTKRPLTHSHDFTFAKNISPVLAPLLTSSPCSLKPTEQLEKPTSESHNPSTNSNRDSSLSQHTEHPERVPTVLEHGRERASQENLELSEQDQTSRCTSEIGDLLCSGNNAKLSFIYLSPYL